jgi:hypothetical protein
MKIPKNVLFKCTVSLFTLCICSSNLMAQDYIPFIDTNRVWEEVTMKTGSFLYPIYFQHKFHYSGDTTINNQEYNKVYRQQVGYGEVEPDSIKSNLGPVELFTLLREDLQKQKVYYHNSMPFEVKGPPYFPLPEQESNFETLLINFDFSASNIGDTVHAAHDFYSIISNVSPVDLGDGIVRKKIEFEDYSNMVYIRYNPAIEGLGFGGGFFEGSGLYLTDFDVESQQGENRWLTYFCQDNTNYFPEFVQDTSNCSGTSAMFDSPMDRGNSFPEIFPNPFDTYINFSEKFSGQIIIMDWSGKILLRAFLNKENRVDFQDDLPSGNYFIGLLNNNGELVILKMIHKMD